MPNSVANFEVPEEEIDQWSVPQPIENERSLQERTKNLYTSMSLKRRGSNYHNFLDKVLNEWKEWIRIGSTDNDPGNSIKGFSQKWYYTTETDLSNKAAESMTKIEFSNTGWSANKSSIKWLLDLHESYFKTNSGGIKIDRAQFNQTSRLRSYDIKSTLILYPKALNFLKDKIINSSDKDYMKFVKDLYSKKKWKRACGRTNRNNSTNKRGFLYKNENREGYCLPRKLRNLTNKRKYQFSESKTVLNNQIHNLVESVFILFKPEQILNILPLDSFFGNIYIGGFRDNDSVGYLQYTSDTLGTYDSKLRTGYFDQFSQTLGLTPYLIKGMTYTPGM